MPGRIEAFPACEKIVVPEAKSLRQRGPDGFPVLVSLVEQSGIQNVIVHAPNKKLLTHGKQMALGLLRDGMTKGYFLNWPVCEVCWIPKEEVMKECDRCEIVVCISCETHAKIAPNTQTFRYRYSYKGPTRTRKICETMFVKVEHDNSYLCRECWNESDNSYAEGSTVVEEKMKEC